MRRQHYWIVLLLLGLLLAACGGSAEEPAAPTPTTAPPEPTAVPTEESAVPEEETAVTEPTESRTFVVVTEESEARYIVNEEFFADALEKLGIAAGKTVVIGRTSGVSGEIQVNLGTPVSVESATFTVDMTGLATDQNRRDRWLRNNAIETSIFPTATFTAVSVDGLPETYTEGETVNFQLTGDLTVRDVTKPVTFDVTAVINGDTLTGTATLNLQMTDFNVTPPDFANTLTVQNDFTIEVDITAREQS
jgi:polyisoprenoid-binding protein YceI